jgi:hypothetical protein
MNAMDARGPNYLQYLQALMDDPLQVARSAANSGTSVVGFVGDEVPVSLIAAAGALPVRLHSVAGKPTARADEFLESAHAPELRIIVERWLTGDLDFLSAVIFSRTDDSAQRIYYYLCELQRRRLCGGPRPLLYDLAKIARPTSIVHSRESTRRLAAELGVKDANLASAVQRVARREALLADVRSRRLASAPLPGGIAWRIHHAAACDWREEFDDATQRWIESASVLSNPRRIVLAGDPPPDDSLHRVVESAGGSVVLELNESIHGALSGSSDLMDAVADSLHACRSPVLAMRENGHWTSSCAQSVRADAVVFWLIEENEALPWEIARQVRDLREKHIPTLLLTRQPWQVDEQARKQLKDFVAGLEVRP